MLTAFLPLFALFAMQEKPPAEPVAAAAESRPALPKAMVEMVDRARNVPPEFGADTLLRIAESDAVPEKALKRELIEEAFRMAGGAQEPLKRFGTKTGTGDSRTSFQARAYAQDLDALTLQSRAVSDMLRVDPPKARELFSAIAPPQAPRLTCMDSLIYDVSAYYETMADVARSAFTPKERAEEEHVKFLSAYAGRISTPVEVGPMAKVLAAAQVTPDQLQALVTAFAAALKSLSGDDRTFSFTIGRQGSVSADLGALVSACSKKQVASLALVDAVRTYLSHQLTGKRCWDTGGPTVTTSVGGRAADPGQPDPVAFFNDQLRKDVYPPGAEVAPLAGDEIRGNGLDFPPDTPPVEESAEAKEVAQKYRTLLYDPSGNAWSDDQKNQSEWQSKLREYVAALAAWKSDGDSGESFYRKSYLLGSLSSVVPNGPLREMVLHAHLEFLEQNPYQQTRRIEWFLPANTLLARVMFDPALAPLAAEMRNSPNAVISLYAQLDKILPRSPGKLMSLM